MTPYAVFIVSTALACAIIVGWATEARRHNRRLARIPLRIHVNGIRGKSTVTRVIAGLLRKAGLTTVGKCTGSAAAVIRPDGSEVPLKRRGAPTILEQIDVIQEEVPANAHAIIIECMALRPHNQAVSEDRLIRSNIGVITNVREDHQDVMGHTLPEIARALLMTCPRDGILVTAEQDPEILQIIRDEAMRRRSRLVVADPSQVTDNDIAGFDHIAFKDNVAIGLAVASLLGIPRDVAMAGMQQATADPGALRLKHVRLAEKRVTWANLFAVNDRESTVLSVKRLAPYRTPDTITVGLLNNREDREQRARQFADIASCDLQFDRLVTIGAYATLVARRLVDNGFPRENIIRFTERKGPSLDELIQRIILDMPKPHVLLIGLGNIHTRHADSLQRYLEGTTTTGRGSPRVATKRQASEKGSCEYVSSDL